MYIKRVLPFNDTSLTRVKLVFFLLLIFCHSSYVLLIERFCLTSIFFYFKSLLQVAPDLPEVHNNDNI